MHTSSNQHLSTESALQTAKRPWPRRVHPPPVAGGRCAQAGFERGCVRAHRCPKRASPRWPTFPFWALSGPFWAAEYLMPVKTTVPYRVVQYQNVLCPVYQAEAEYGIKHSELPLTLLFAWYSLKQATKTGCFDRRHAALATPAYPSSMGASPKSKMIEVN